MAERLIDVVGHFGTTFSYATVASKVARALDAKGLLNSVSNLDEAWHESHHDLRRSHSGNGTHLLLFTAPNHYIDVYTKQYGRKCSALFISPNTDTLADEHAMTAARFGLLLAPSAWCEHVVRSHVPDTQVVMVPLGVDSWYAATRESRVKALQGRMLRTGPGTNRTGEVTRVLHFSTDQHWPGRKGSEELLQAWAILKAEGGPLRRGVKADVTGHDGVPSIARGTARLTMHMPPSLQRDATYMTRDLGIDDSVDVVVGKVHGFESEMESLWRAHDLVVAPSRCEGFGMMLLASLVAGVPLVSTYVTGQQDFLAESPGWVGIPTARTGPLASEQGSAPVVEPRAIAQALGAAWTFQTRTWLLETLAQPSDSQWGTWESVLPLWMDALEWWMENE